MPRSLRPRLGPIYTIICLCILAPPALSNKHHALLDSIEEWAPNTQYPELDTGYCNIDSRDRLSVAQFMHQYWGKKPVVLTNVTYNGVAREITRKRNLLDLYGSSVITLSSANTNSYDKIESTLNKYVETQMGPFTLDDRGNEKFYHFGDNHHDEWKTLFSAYNNPYFNETDCTSGNNAGHTSCLSVYPKGSTEPALSFGLGGSGSGVPFHVHGAVFAEVFHGTKRWFLYPPGDAPEFDPNSTSLFWTKTRYKSLRQQPRSRPLECACRPGDVIYIPDNWWHSTLNLGQTVFISVFL